MNEETSAGAAGRGSAPQPPAVPIDPWEARERERARHSRAAAVAAPRRANGGKGGDDPLSLTLAGYLSGGLVAAIAALLLGETRQIATDVRSILTVAGSALVLLLVASARSYADDLRRAVLRGPNPFLLCLLAWSVAEYFLSPYRGIAAFGSTELLRVVTGAGVYFLAAYALRSPKEIVNVTVGLVCVACALALADLWQMGATGTAAAGVRDRNLFGTHENLAALLLLVLPIPLSFSLSQETEEKRRLFALAGTLILGAALVLARSRSGWIGGIVAVTVLGLLIAWTRPRAAASGGDTGGSRRHRRGARTLAAWIASPAALIAMGLASVVLFGGVSATIAGRASIRRALGDPNLDGRVTVWKAASRMVTERPLLGWGLGSYWLHQGHWTHAGTDIVDVPAAGAFQDNNAHDYYLQWAADTGAPGLFLYAGTIAALLAAGFRGAREIRREEGSCPAAGRPSHPPFQKALLLGCMASIAGASVDAIASPAYVFHGIGGVFWLVAGLGVAALRPVVAARAGQAAPPGDAPAPVPALPRTSPGAWAAAVVPAGLIVAIVLGAGYRQRALGARVLRGSLGIRADVAGAALPGQRITWRAIFRDETGQEVNTYPGTFWELTSDRDTVQSLRLLALDRTDRSPLTHAGLSLAPSGAERTVTVHAVYYDAYGRRYDAYSEIAVRPRPATAGRGASARRHR